MTNEFLQPAINFLKAHIELKMGGLVTLETVLEMLEAIPTQAAYCPVCCGQRDVPSGEVPAPTVVRMRSCGHVACDSCSRHCADHECANDCCGDCYVLCEGHGDALCRECAIEKRWCRECVPEKVARELGQMEYADAMRD